MFGGKFDLDHLNEYQRGEMLKIINKHKNIFAEEVKNLTGCDTIKHRVHLTDDIPFRFKPYRTPYALKQEIKRQIDDLLDTGIISVSDSQYSSPVLLMEKKKNTYHLVCDYRKSNLKTQP